MSFILKACAETTGDCLAIKVFDQTGDSPEGYGGANPEISEVTAATVSVLLPGASTPIVIDVYPTLPSADDDDFVLINASELGLTILPDGLYEFIYTISGIQDTIPFTIEFAFTEYFFCNVKCCVKKAGANASFPSGNKDCDCNNPKALEDRFLEMQTILDMIQYSAGCGQSNNADNLLVRLQKMCSSSC